MTAFLTSTAMPLADVTNTRMSLGNTLSGKKPAPFTPSAVETPMGRSAIDALSHEMMSPMSEVPTPLFQQEESPVRVRQNDPYSWNVLPVMHQVSPTPDMMVLTMMQQQAAQAQAAQAHQQQAQMQVSAPSSPLGIPVIKDVAPENFTVTCRCLVQFKCHHAEYASPITLMKGQYVVVHGDRGIDVGVVIRINTDDAKQYVERTGPAGSVIRHATQREVDYWATELKNDETAALEYCRVRLAKHNLPMDIRHAEYQFDKKKLTFYYESKTRVDFVTLLKELFREFSCRIWMEKVRVNEC